MAKAQLAVNCLIRLVNGTPGRFRASRHRIPDSHVVMEDLKGHCRYAQQSIGVNQEKNQAGVER